VADHFADVGKMVDLDSGSQREVDDMMLNSDALAPVGATEVAKPVPLQQPLQSPPCCGLLPIFV
jgi:DNA-damage-inducible protein D